MLDDLVRRIPHGEGEQLVRRPVEHILIPRERARARVLEERVHAPTGRDSRRTTRVRIGRGDPQRIVTEAGVVARAVAPPAVGRINHRPPIRPIMNRTREISNPRRHPRRAQPIAPAGPVCRTIRVVLDIQHRRQRTPIRHPTRPMGEEEHRLRRARRLIGQRKMITTPHKPRVRRTRIVRVKHRVQIRRALTRLHISELRATRRHRSPISRRPGSAAQSRRTAPWNWLERTRTCVSSSVRAHPPE